MKTVPFKQLPPPPRQAPAPVPGELSTRLPLIGGVMQRLSSGSWLVSLSTVASESVHVVAGVAGSSLRLNGLGVHLRKDCCGFDLLGREGSWPPWASRLCAKVCVRACVRTPPAACASPGFGPPSPPFAWPSSLLCAPGAAATLRPVSKVGAGSRRSGFCPADPALLLPDHPQDLDHVLVPSQRSDPCAPVIGMN